MSAFAVTTLLLLKELVFPVLAATAGNSSECLSNRDCPSDRLCAEFQCINPCLLNLCDDPRNCKVTNHIPVCSCNRGFSGVLANEDSSSKIPKPPRWRGAKRFQLNTIIKMNWYQALAQCFANNMRLASIESKEEFDLVVGMIQKANLTPNDFWTSGADLGEKSTYIWMSSGRPMTYFNWGDNNPSHTDRSGNIEQCVELSWGIGFLMNDASCLTPRLHVCEYYE